MFEPLYDFDDYDHIRIHAEKKLKKKKMQKFQIDYTLSKLGRRNKM